MAIYLRPWFETTLNIWQWVSLFVIFAGSPVVSESPKLHKLLSRGRAVVALHIAKEFADEWNEQL